MSFNWDVTRVTTEKLADELNDLAWEVYQLQYIGGRDWILISRDPDHSQEMGPRIYDGKARRLGQEDWWTIRIPGVGVTQCERAVDIQHEAEALIVAAEGIALKDFRADITVDASRDLD